MKHCLSRLLALVCAAALLVTSASALTLEQAVALLEQYYVDKLPAEAYEAQTLDELFQAVGDPYTYYMDAEEYESFNSSVEGESKVGIGVAITFGEDGIRISRIIPGGTAEKAGLKAGDVIVAVDGVSCAPAQESDATLVTGEEGTLVTVEILHEDGSRESFTLERRGFTVPTTTAGLLENGPAYLDCDSFAGNTGTTFAEEIEKYDGQTDLWLVDVRDNLGGRVDGARDAAGVFTGPGFILWLRDAAGNYYYHFNVGEAQTAAPAVVLTNGRSASASEVFTAAVKDYGAGIVLGGRTYGKGVAQIILNEDSRPDLFDGDALKITAYRYYNADLNTMDCIGTLPTLLLPDSQTKAVALLLHAREPEEAEGWLRLTLNGWDFYIDVPSALASEEDGEENAALSALFAALAPDVPAAVFGRFGSAENSEEDGWETLSVPEAARRLGVEYTSRWFTDVEDSPYGDQLNTLATYVLLRGVGEGEFHPDGNLTRAELCALLCLTLNRISYSHSPFSDVGDWEWYAPYVTEMYEMGLVCGKGEGRFDPDAPVTQQELITVLGRLAAFLNANCGDLMKQAEAVEEMGEEISLPELEHFDSWARLYAWLLGEGYRENVDSETENLYFCAPELADPRAAVLREEAGAAVYSLLTGLGILRL